MLPFSVSHAHGSRLVVVVDETKLTHPFSFALSPAQRGAIDYRPTACSLTPASQRTDSEECAGAKVYRCERDARYAFTHAPNKEKPKNSLFLAKMATSALHIFLGTMRMIPFLTNRRRMLRFSFNFSPTKQRFFRHWTFYIALRNPLQQRSATEAHTPRTKCVCVCVVCTDRRKKNDKDKRRQDYLAHHSSQQHPTATACDC